MPSTEPVESLQGSKRKAGTLGMTTRSRSRARTKLPAQQESQSVPRTKKTATIVGSKRKRSVASIAAAAAAATPPGMATRSRARTQQAVPKTKTKTKTGKGGSKMATRTKTKTGEGTSKMATRTKTGEGGSKMATRTKTGEGGSKMATRTKTGEGGSKMAKLDGVKGSKIEEGLPEWWEEEYENWLNWSEDFEYSSSSSAASSVVSSPIRVPYMTNETTGDSEVAKQYMELSRAFRQKLDRQMAMPTLTTDVPPNCMFDDPTLLHIREPARKVVLRAAQFIVGVSSSIDGKPLARCTGFLIDLDVESRIGTVVTTAFLIRTKHPSKNPWACKDQYASDAKVNVHLPGCRYPIVEGNLLYYQKHYNIAFFRVRVDQTVQLPSFSDNVKSAQDIFEIGRDERLDLLINHGRVEYSNPTTYERHHHMYIQGPQRDRMYDKGGPVIDLDGKVVGMIDDSCSRGSFIPSSILLKCFHLWRNFRRIPRPHLGLQFNAISLLNPAQAEHILNVYGIDEGLVVHEVSEDSPAEKCGIRIGDVIECLNGKSISTTVELENMLLSIMENSGDGLNSNLDLKIQVCCARRSVRKVKVLTVNVSDDGERCVPGGRLVS